jgi:glycopeptide antibiotics resistance protein
VLPQFSSFYKKAAIFFYVVYFGVLVYWFAVYNRIPENEISAQFIPFATFAAYVDGVISDTVPLERLLQFAAERIGMFLPYGFFIAMAGRRIHSLLRLGLVLVFPLIVELLQYILKFNTFDMDDAIFSFLGGLFGMLLFVIFNALFQKTTGKNFDGSEIEKDYYGRRI